MLLDQAKLRILAMTCEARSVSLVALDTGLAQSSVSYTLDQLRKDLNDQLFVRVGRSLEPTPYLEQRIAEVRKLLADFESLPKRTFFEPTRFNGTVRFIANVSEQMLLLKNVTQQLRWAAPDANLRLLGLGSRERLLDAINYKKAQCEITVPPPLYPPELLHKSLHKSAQVIYFDPRRRMPISSIDEYYEAEHAILDFGGTMPSTVDNAIKRSGRSRRTALSAPNVSALATLFKGTTLICTMQASLAHSVFHDLANAEPPFDLPEIQFHLVWHRRDAQDPVSKWLHQLMEMSTQELML